MIRERRRTKQENNSGIGKGNLYILTGLIIGLLLGLVISWVIAPIKYIETAPNSLRVDIKNEYRLLIAAAYHANYNLPRALARIELLSDPDPLLALTTQAQDLLKSGDINGKAFYLAYLADAIKTASISQAGISANATKLPITSTPSPTGISDGFLTGTPSFITSITPIIRLSETPIATQMSRFILKSQQIVCDSTQAELLLMIDVFDPTNLPIPGVEIIITWSNGEEHIFTGLQPEISEGYVDYLMSPNIDYGIRFASGGVSTIDLAAPDCTNNQGTAKWGGIKLVFQKP
jgi:hypothetical protein